MRKVACVATFKGREKALDLMLDSIGEQFDQVYIYSNEIATIDLTDNGKFIGLLLEKEPCYYFTLDDDLIYPSNYAQTMIETIERTHSIVSCHGRILKGLDLNYYNGHEFYSCLGNVKYNGAIDVAGTGVTAFRTDHFNPIHIAFNSNQRMSDLIFSYFAKKEGKLMVMQPHERGWIKDCGINHIDNINSIEIKQQQRLIYVANRIYGTGGN